MNDKLNAPATANQAQTALDIQADLVDRSDTETHDGQTVLHELAKHGLPNEPFTILATPPTELHDAYKATLQAKADRISEPAMQTYIEARRTGNHYRRREAELDAQNTEIAAKIRDLEIRRHQSTQGILAGEPGIQDLITPPFVERRRFSQERKFNYEGASFAPKAKNLLEQAGYPDVDVDRLITQTMELFNADSIGPNSNERSTSHLAIAIAKANGIPVPDTNIWPNLSTLQNNGDIQGAESLKRFLAQGLVKAHLEGTIDQLIIDMQKSMDADTSFPHAERDRLVNEMILLSQRMRNSQHVENTNVTQQLRIQRELQTQTAAEIARIQAAQGPNAELVAQLQTKYNSTDYRAIAKEQLQRDFPQLDFSTAESFATTTRALAEKTITPEQIEAGILQQLKEGAERDWGLTHIPDEIYAVIATDLAQAREHVKLDTIADWREPMLMKGYQALVIADAFFATNPHEETTQVKRDLADLSTIATQARSRYDNGDDRTKQGRLGFYSYARSQFPPNHRFNTDPDYYALVASLTQTISVANSDMVTSQDLAHQCSPAFIYELNTTVDRVIAQNNKPTGFITRASQIIVDTSMWLTKVRSTNTKSASTPASTPRAGTGRTQVPNTNITTGIGGLTSNGPTAPTNSVGYDSRSWAQPYAPQSAGRSS